MSVQMNKLELNKTELAYITDVNRKSMKFFAQLCRFTNKELIEFNEKISDYCKEVVAELGHGNADIEQLSLGTICCAKYSLDKSWYRSSIIKTSEISLSCKVLFVDYGNIESIPIANIVLVDPIRLPCIKRVPFGSTCHWKEADKLDDEKKKHFLKSIFNNYVMLKFDEPDAVGTYQVSIPYNAYNIPFWHTFKPELDISKRAGNRTSDETVELKT